MDRGPRGVQREPREGVADFFYPIVLQENQKEKGRLLKVLLKIKEKVQDEGANGSHIGPGQRDSVSLAARRRL